MQTVPPDLDERFPADADSVGRARHAVARFAAAAGAREPELDGIRLAVSEAVTNAVVHGYRGEPGEVRVTAALDRDGALRVVIHDAGSGMRRQADRPGMGLGLGLIAEFTEEMALVPHAEGTELRMCFTLAATKRPHGPARAQGSASAPASPCGLFRGDPGYRAAVAAS